MSREYWTTTNEAGSGTAWSTEHISQERTTIENTVLYSDGINPIDLSGDFVIHGQIPLSAGYRHIEEESHTNIRYRDFQREFISEWILPDDLIITEDIRSIITEDIRRISGINRRYSRSDMIKSPTWHDIDNLCNKSDLPILYPTEEEIRRINESKTNHMVHTILKGLLNDDK